MLAGKEREGGRKGRGAGRFDCSLPKLKRLVLLMYSFIAGARNGIKVRVNLQIDETSVSVVIVA